MNYLLELRNAVKVETGIYKWSFGERNLSRPSIVEIGPVSVTSDTDYRNVVILSETFRDSNRPFVNRSNELKGVLTVVHPEFRSTHAPDTATGTSQSAEAGSDESIDDIGSALLAWIDLDNSRVLDANSQPATGAGSNVNYVYNRGPNSSLIWSLSYGANMTLAVFGETVALYRVGSWQSLADSTPLPAGTMDDEFCVHTLFQINSINDYTFFFYFDAIRILMLNGNLCMQTVAGNTTTVITNLTVLPLQQYMLSVHRRIVGGNPEFYYRLEKLSDNTVQESTSAVTGPVPSGSTTWRIGVPNTHFYHYQGPFIIHNGLDADHITNSRQWLRNAHNIENTGGSGSATTTPTQWFQLYDTRVTNIKMQQGFSEVIRDVTLEFENHLGERFDPKDFVCHMRAK